MSQRTDIIRDTARRDYEEEDSIYIPPTAEVIEEADGYWIEAMVWIEKDAA